MRRRFLCTMAVLNLAGCGGSTLSNVVPEAGTGGGAGMTGMGGAGSAAGGATGQSGNDGAARGGSAAQGGSAGAGGGAGTGGAASGGGAGRGGGAIDAALPSGCEAGADPAKTYLGTSPAACATIRFTCPSGSDPFSDQCGCGCLRTCATIQCFRAINCVTACSGSVISSGCCPCSPPAFDSIECRLDAGSSE